jgi:hypothetical protein
VDRYSHGGGISVIQQKQKKSPPLVSYLEDRDRYHHAFVLLKIKVCLLNHSLFYSCFGNKNINK